MFIRPTSPLEFDALTAVWEASVKATHHFLAPEDIERLRGLVRHQYLALLDLRVGVDENDRIGGFVGVADGKVEMLFVAPDRRGQGIGTALLRHATARMGAGLVDVNEQNPDAVGFYRRFGFEVVGRSATDGQGRPFPLLHMRLNLCN